MRYKQAIQVGRNITDIMALPCVIFCHKVNLNPMKVVYYLFGDTIASHLPWGYAVIAHEGDWLCEDYEGKWHLVTDKEYRDGYSDK